MFNFQEWIAVFRDYYNQLGIVYNDAADYGVSIDIPENRIWKVLGIHHLYPSENKEPNEEFGKHNVYIEMLCKQNEREGFRAIHWTWEGRQPNENAPDVFAGQKPLDEVVDIPLNLGMNVSVWTNGGEIAKGFSSNHPDEETGNTIGHHSFFVCLQEIGEDPTIPPIEPPNIETVGNVAIKVNQDYVMSLVPDNEGNVRIEVDINASI